MKKCVKSKCTHFTCVSVCVCVCTLHSHVSVLTCRTLCVHAVQRTGRREGTLRVESGGEDPSPPPSPVPPHPPSHPLIVFGADRGSGPALWENTHSFHESRGKEVVQLHSHPPPPPPPQNNPPPRPPSPHNVSHVLHALLSTQT